MPLIDADILVFSTMAGFSCAVLGHALSFSMQYRHLLGWYKLFRAKRIAQKIGIDDWFNEELHKAREKPHSEAIDHMNGVYDYIATRDAMFAGLDCVICLSSRLAAICGIALWLYSGCLTCFAIVVLSGYLSIQILKHV